MSTSREGSEGEDEESVALSHRGPSTHARSATVCFFRMLTMSNQPRFEIEFIIRRGDANEVNDYDLAVLYVRALHCKDTARWMSSRTTSRMGLWQSSAGSL